MLSYVTSGDDVQVLGSLSVLATFLQTKGCTSDSSIVLDYCLQLFSHQFLGAVELDETMLDALGILPQRKQHKKLLLVCCGVIILHII